MSKLFLLLLTVCSVFILQLGSVISEAISEEESVDFIDINIPFPFLPRSVSSESSEESQNGIERWGKHKHHHNRGHLIHLDICKCHNDSCECCIQLSKYKLCDNLRLVYPSNSTQNLAIDFKVTANNMTLLSDEVSLDKLPAFCYRAASIRICGKFYVQSLTCKNKEEAELCGEIQLKLNSETLAHINVFCMRIGRNFNLTEGSEVKKEPEPVLIDLFSI